MTITTNAGNDDRLSPAQRRAAELDDTHALHQLAGEEAARLSAARRQRHRLKLVQLEAQQNVSIEVDGEERKYEAVALDFEFEEPIYDASIPSLGPYIIGNQYDECVWWPFKPKGARAGLRPRLGPGAWDAILEDGLYCIRCLWRHEKGPWPEECTHCYLTAAHRDRALDHLERQAQLWQEAGPNREQRRAQQRAARRSKGGVILPGFAGG